MGAPSKLCPEVIEKICRNLRAGAYIETAALYAGISKKTFYAWLKKGSKAKKGLELDLCNAVEEAQAAAEMRDLINIDNAAMGAPTERDAKGQVLREEISPNWQASAWRLERKFPKKWGRIERHEHTGEDGAAIKFEETRKTLVELGKDSEAFDALMLVASKIEKHKKPE